MVIHLLELGFILLTYCVQEFWSVAGVGENFLMNAKLKPLCGGKFVNHRCGTQSVGILAYGSKVMWPCVYWETDTILCWKICGLAGHLCVFLNQKFVFCRLHVGRNDNTRTPHPGFILIVWILFVFLLEGSGSVYSYDF
jgi:hypothetical protein